MLFSEKACFFGSDLKRYAGLFEHIGNDVTLACGAEQHSRIAKRIFFRGCIGFIEINGIKPQAANHIFNFFSDGHGFARSFSQGRIPMLSGPSILEKILLHPCSSRVEPIICWEASSTTCHRTVILG